MQKKILPLLMAVLGGVAGFFLRKWNLSVGFEPDTGLAIPGAVSGIVLLLWTCLVIVGILATTWQYKADETGVSILSGGEQNTVYITAVLFSAVLLLASAGLDALAFSMSGSINGQMGVVNDTALARTAAAVLPPVRIFLCAGGLLTAGIWGRSVYRGTEGRRESLALLELCLLFCVWLISDYQTRAADPVIQDYAYAVFAIAAALVGLYYLASISFGESHPRRALLFGLVGIYFCLLTLADSHTLADVFRYGFAILFLTAHVVLLLSPKASEEMKMESDNNG